MNNKISFASDNYVGVHPEVMESIATVNVGYARAYGEDLYTDKTIRMMKKQFGEQIEVFFVYNGTAANVLGLQAVTQSYQSIICADTAHVHVDECGAVEKLIGCKLVPIPTKDGKLSPEKIKPYLVDIGDKHRSQPHVITITQSTEWGTVYTLEEIRAIASFAHDHGLLLHMDGARLSNATAFLGVSLKEITVDAGVDILSFGGTKNGIMYGEAVIFFQPTLANEFQYIRKQGMQLGSKIRFIAAQFAALFTNNLWHTNALHANLMANRLAEEIKQIPSIQIMQDVQTNVIFASLPYEQITKLQEEFSFYIWDEHKNIVRWMTSYCTTEEEVDLFAKKIKEVCL